MIAERSKACRALPQPVRPKRIQKLMSNDDRERPTDPIASHAPLTQSEAPPLLAIPPNARTPEPQPDPNSYSDWAMSQLLNRVRGLEADRGAMSMADFEAALDRNTQKILHETGADIGLLRSSVNGVQQSLDALVTRVGNTEREVAANRTATSESAEKLERLELDMAAMRSQLDRLNREVAILRAVKDATTEAKPEAPAAVPNPASG